MTDRTTVVTIGAVLAANFRTTFTEARREVDALSRALDLLGGRRSNAGLLGVRDAASKANTALNDVRTRARGIGDALDTMNKKATAAASSTGNIAKEAKKSAAELGTLKTAIDGLNSGKAGSKGIDSLAASATKASRTVRGLRMSTSAMGSALDKFDTRLNRVSKSLGTFAQSARTAASSLRSLNRVTATLNSTLNGQTANVNAATAALHRHAAASTSAAAASARFNRHAGGHGGGGAGSGGGGRSGGGSGGHRPLGVHAGLHALFGESGKDALAGDFVHTMWEQGAGLAHERVMRQMQGWSDEEIAEGEKQAMRVSRAIGSVTKREGMKIIGEMGFVLGNRKEAIDVLPMAARATALLHSVNPEMDGAKNAYNMVRALELMNKANHQDIGPWMEAMTAAMFASGGKVTGRDFQQFAAQSGAGAQYYTKDFLTQVAPTVIQELGGAKAGTAMNTMRRALAGGKMTKDALENLAELGLLDPTKTDYAQKGLSRVHNGWIRNQHHHGSPGAYTQPTISVRKGAVVEGDLLQRDPYQWVQKVLKKHLIDHAVTAPEKIAETLTHTFSDRNAERIASIMLLQSLRTEKDRTQIVEALQTATMNRLRNDPTYALQSLKTQWENLLGNSGQAFGEKFGIGRGMSTIADGLGAIANMSPAALSSLTAIGASAVAVPAALWGIGTAANVTRGALSTMGGALTRIGVLFRSPYFLAFAAAGYLISKNWSRVGPVVEAVLEGVDKGFSRIGRALEVIDNTATSVLRFFGLADDGSKRLGDSTDKTSKGLEHFSDIIGKVVFTLASVAAGRLLWNIATGFRSIATAIGLVNAVSAAGGFMRLLTMLGGPAGKLLGAAMVVIGATKTAHDAVSPKRPESKEHRGWADYVGPAFGDMVYGHSEKNSPTRRPGRGGAPSSRPQRKSAFEKFLWWPFGQDDGDETAPTTPRGRARAPDPQHQKKSMWSKFLWWPFYQDDEEETAPAPQEEPTRRRRPRRPEDQHLDQGPTAAPRPRPRTTPIAGARALGGSVMANKPYLVGERGPEIFVPNGAGSIETNNALRKINADAADNDNAPAPARRTPMSAPVSPGGALGPARTPSLAPPRETAASGAPGRPGAPLPAAMNASAPMSPEAFMLSRELRAAQAEVDRIALAQGAHSIGAHGWDALAEKARARLEDLKRRLAGQVTRNTTPAAEPVNDNAPRRNLRRSARPEAAPAPPPNPRDSLPDLGDQSVAERMLGVMPLPKAQRERQKADPSTVPNLEGQTWMQWLFGSAPTPTAQQTAPERAQDHHRGEEAIKRGTREGVRDALQGLVTRTPGGRTIEEILRGAPGEAGGSGPAATRAAAEGGETPQADRGTDKPSDTAGYKPFKMPSGGGRFNGFSGDHPAKTGRRKGGGGEGGGGGFTPSSLEMPKTSDGVTDPTSVKGLLFKGESGGNPGIYNYRSGGRYHVGHLDADNTTVSELMRKQANKEVFAAGKYQIIPETMKGAVKALGLKGDEKFNGALQDRIYTDYLAGSKRPQISNYITGKNDDLDAANKAMAQEWASVGYHGHGIYDKDGVNHASISGEKAQAALQKARAEYQRLTAAGVDPETARRSALLGIRDPKSGAPGGTPAVAGGEQPKGLIKTAYEQPASPANDNPATGGGGLLKGQDIGSALKSMKRNGLVSDEQCVTLAMASVGVQKRQGDAGWVNNWRKGENAETGTLQPGTPLATFLADRNHESNLYAGGTGGREKAHLDHAVVFEKYVKDAAGKITGMIVQEQYKGSHGVHQKQYNFGQGWGEGDARNYFAVKDKNGGYLGGANNPMNHATHNADAAGDGAKAAITHAATAKAAVQDAVAAKQQVASAAGGRGDWNYTKGDTHNHFNLPHGAGQTPRQYASAVAGHQGRQADNEAAELRSSTMDWVA